MMRGFSMKIDSPSIGALDMRSGENGWYEDVEDEYADLMSDGEGLFMASPTLIMESMSVWYLENWEESIDFNSQYGNSHYYVRQAPSKENIIIR